MNRAPAAVSEAVKRFFHQRGRVTALHLVALVAVGAGYVMGGGGFDSRPFCVKSCGAEGLFGSVIAWWPIAVSWLVVRHPGETSTSFRWWQVLFALINISTVVWYLGSMGSTLDLKYESLWPIAHLLLMLVIAPLAIEMDAAEVVVSSVESPDMPAEREK